MQGDVIFIKTTDVVVDRKQVFAVCRNLIFTQFLLILIRFKVNKKLFRPGVKITSDVNPGTLKKNEN